MVRIRVDQDVVTDGFPNVAHEVDVVDRVPPELDLERANAALDRLLGVSQHRLRRVAEEYCRNGNGLRLRSAQQTPDRLTEDLAFEIPQRGVDQCFGDRRAFD